MCTPLFPGIFAFTIERRRLFSYQKGKNPCGRGCVCVKINFSYSTLILLHNPVHIFLENSENTILPFFEITKQHRLMNATHMKGWDISTQADV